MAVGKHRLIEEAKERVAQILEQRIRDEGMTLDEIEAAVELTVREVAGWVEERLIEEQQPPPSNRAACPRCGAPCAYKRDLGTTVLTIHGPRKIRRRYHHCRACEKGFSPTDAVLGLEPGRDATRQVRGWMARFGSETAFAAVPEVFAELRGFEVSASTVERTTVEVGQVLREQAPSWEPPEIDPEAPTAAITKDRLYLSMDGTMCPLRNPWKRDGSEGKLQCRYGEAKLGVVFQTRRKDDLDTEVVRRGCVGTMGEVGVFLPLLLALARQWRLGTTRELVALGDGAEWIWLLVGTHFPNALQILDFWHLTEHLYRVANAMHGKGNQAAKAWVERAQWDLKHDLTTSFLLSLEEWNPQTDDAREVRRVELGYFKTNASRMKYGAYLKKGYMIGSGVMESACRQLATQRLDRAGMHWREETADAVLAIRAHQRSSGAPPLSHYA